MPEMKFAVPASQFDGLGSVHAVIAEHCAAIAGLFAPGAKVTVIVRNPVFDNVEHGGSLMIGDDEPEQVIGAVRYLAGRDARKLTEADYQTRDNPGGVLSNLKPGDVIG